MSGGGVAVFENGAWTSYTAKNSEIPTWSNDDVTGDFRAIVVDQGGNPWAGTWTTQQHPSQVWPYVDAILAHLEGDHWTAVTFPDQGFISALPAHSDRITLSDRSVLLFVDLEIGELTFILPP